METSSLDVPPLSPQVCESDHKPVFMELELTVPSYIQETKHKHSLAMLAAVAADAAESEAGSGGGSLGRVSFGASAGGGSRAPSSALREVTSRGSFDTRPGAGPGREGPPAPIIVLSMEGVPHGMVPAPWEAVQHHQAAAEGAVSGVPAAGALVPLLQLRTGSHVRVLVSNGGQQPALVSAAGGGGAAGGRSGTGAARYPSWLEVRLG